MQDAILEKLSPCLARAPESESEVVYVLVEIRKLHERDPKRKISQLLIFYCEWALHAEMSRTVAKRVLQEINVAVASGADGKKRFFEKFAFEEFRIELQDFCGKNGLPTKWGSAEVWPQFVRHYAAIVQDCPLRIIETRPTSNDIRKVILTGCWSGKSQNSFQVCWELHYRDGTCEAVETVLSPDFASTLYKGAYDIWV